MHILCILALYQGYIVELNTGYEATCVAIHPVLAEIPALQATAKALGFQVFFFVLSLPTVDWPLPVAGWQDGLPSHPRASVTVSLSPTGLPVPTPSVLPSHTTGYWRLGPVHWSQHSMPLSEC